MICGRRAFEALLWKGLTAAKTVVYCAPPSTAVAGVVCFVLMWMRCVNCILSAVTPTLAAWTQGQVASTKLQLPQAATHPRTLLPTAMLCGCRAGRAAGAAAYQECAVWLVSLPPAEGSTPEQHQAYQSALLAASVAAQPLGEALSSPTAEGAELGAATVVGVAEKLAAKAAAGKEAGQQLLAASLEGGLGQALDAACPLTGAPASTTSAVAADGASFTRLQSLLSALASAAPPAATAVATRAAAWVSARLRQAGFGAEGGAKAAVPAAALQLMSTLVTQYGVGLGAAASAAPSVPSDAEAAPALGVNTLVAACRACPFEGPEAVAKADLLISCILQQDLPDQAWAQTLNLLWGGDRDKAEGGEGSGGLAALALLADQLSIRPSSSSVAALDNLLGQLCAPSALQSGSVAAGSSVLGTCPLVRLLASGLGCNPGRRVLVSQDAAGRLLSALLSAMSTAIDAPQTEAAAAAAAAAAAVVATALGPGGAKDLWALQASAVAALIPEVLRLAWVGAEQGGAVGASLREQEDGDASEGDSDSDAPLDETEDSQSDGHESEGDEEEGARAAASAVAGMHLGGAVGGAEGTSAGVLAWYGAAAAHANSLWANGGLLRNAADRIPGELPVVVQSVVSLLAAKVVAAAGKPHMVHAVQTVATLLHQAHTSLAAAPAQRRALMEGMLSLSGMASWCRWSGQGGATGSTAMHTAMLHLVWRLIKLLGCASLLGVRQEESGEAASGSSGHEGRAWLVVEVVCAMHAPGRQAAVAKQAGQHLVDHFGVHFDAPACSACYASAARHLAGKSLQEDATASTQHTTYTQALLRLLHPAVTVVQECGQGQLEAITLLDTLTSHFLCKLTPAHVVANPSSAHVAATLQVLTAVAPALRSQPVGALSQGPLPRVSDTWLDHALTLPPVNSQPSPAAAQALCLVAACLPAPTQSDLQSLSAYSGPKLRVTPSEATKLLALFKLQAGYGAAAAAALRAAGSTTGGSQGETAPPTAVAGASREAMALLNLSVAYYCVDDMDAAMWRSSVSCAQDVFQQACSGLTGVCRQVLGAVKQAAAEVLNQTDQPGGSMALQLLRKLQHSGVLFKHPAHKALVAAVDAALATWAPGPDMAPALRLVVLWLGAVHSDVSNQRASSSQQAAAAVLRQHMELMQDCHNLVMQLQMGMGALAALCDACGPDGEHAASAWASASPVWSAVAATSTAILKQPGTSTAGAAQTALAATDAWLAGADAGMDGVDALLHLALAPSQPLASASYLALLCCQESALARLSTIDEDASLEEMAEYDQVS